MLGNTKIKYKTTERRLNQLLTSTHTDTDNRNRKKLNTADKKKKNNLSER